MEITNEKWMSKQEAAVHLGTINRPMSTRRVLELAKDGQLDSARVKDPNTGQTVVRILSESVQKYLDCKANPEPIPDPLECEPQTSQALSHTSRLTGRARDLMELLTLLREGSANRTPALFLTLAQAAEYSGLPTPILRQWIGEGKLKALDVGIRRGGRWRIRRLDLESV